MKITSNFYKISLSKNEITVPYIQFQNEEQLQELRENYPDMIHLPYQDKIFFWGNGDIKAKNYFQISDSTEKRLF